MTPIVDLFLQTIAILFVPAYHQHTFDFTQEINMSQCLSALSAVPNETVCVHAIEYYDTFTPILDAALELAQRLSLSISPPINVGEKSPFFCWKEYQTRKAAPHEIIEWGLEYPEHNYGLLTGRTAGVVVVEGDDQEAQQLIKERCPDTPMVQRSGSGRGFHYFFRYPKELAKVKTQSGITVDGKKRAIDIRGDGGLVVGPTSLHKKGGRYQQTQRWPSGIIESLPVFDPSWLDQQRITQAEEVQSASESRFSDIPRTTKQEAAREYLSAQPGTQQGEGASNKCYHLACVLVRDFDLEVEDALPVFCEWGEKQSNRDADGYYLPWTETELHHKLTSAAQHIDANDPLRGSRLPVVIDEQRLTELFETSAPEVKRKGLTLYTWDELKQRMLEEPPMYIVKDLIALSDIGMISSLPGAGKSSIIAKMIGCIAQGTPFLEMDTKQHPVVFINSDQNSYHLIGERIGSHISTDEEEEQLRRMLYLPKFEEIPAPFPDDYVKQVIEATEERIGSNRPNKGLIIIDTMRTAFLTGSENGSENDTSALLRFIAPLKKLARASGWAILIVHHNTKGSNSYAGGAIIKGQMEFTVNMKRDDNSTIAYLDVWTRRNLMLTMPVERHKDGSFERLHGNTNPEALAIDPFDALVQLLPQSEGAALTANEIRDEHDEFLNSVNWNTLKTLQNKLSILSSSNRVQRVGHGNKHCPHRYFIIPKVLP